MENKEKKMDGLDPEVQERYPSRTITVQGLRITLLQVNNETDVSIARTGRPGEITLEQFLASYGSQDPDFVFGLIRQLANIDTAHRFPDGDGLIFKLAFVREMAPRDVVEATIATQMAVVFAAMMKAANRLTSAWVEEPAEIENSERSLSRLSRIYCQLGDFLDRHRNGNHTKIAVQQVSVAAGAQAIVGDVHQGAENPAQKINGHANDAKARKLNGHANGAKARRKLNGHASA